MSETIKKLRQQLTDLEIEKDNWNRCMDIMMEIQRLTWTLQEQVELMA